MAARDDRGRIQLQAADRLHQRDDVVGGDGSGAWAAQSLARNGQLPRVLDANLTPAAQARDSSENVGSGTSQR
jgi:hypothetical protein